MSININSVRKNMVLSSVNTTVVSASALFARDSHVAYVCGTDENKCGFTSWHNR